MRDGLIDTEEFTHRGFTFVANIYYAEDFGPPWKEHDGHGPVSDWTKRPKGPGEMILHQDCGSYHYYNFAEAVKIAKREGWDAPPYGGTKEERAHRAAMADYQYLRRWCNDDWQWVGISVVLHGEQDQFAHAVWGIESDAAECLKEVRVTLADDLLHDRGLGYDQQARDMEDQRPDMYQHKEDAHV
jgi:hypothetical protein